MRLVNS